MKQKKESYIGIVIGGIVSVIVIGGLWYFSYVSLKDLTENERGTFGEMFGGVNALFSGFALAGIIFTILLQRKELSYQREELKETRLEFKIQNKTLKIQRFENTFFNLLSLHHKIVDGIDHVIKVKKDDTPSWVDEMSMKPTEYVRITEKGRDVFKWWLEEFNQEYNNQKPKNFNEFYINFYPKVQTDFGHYFRNLYRIIKFVEGTCFTPLEEVCENVKSPTLVELTSFERINNELRYSYISMVRAQLSDFELLWLFYNCLSENGEEKFKPLIEKYCLFKNLQLVHLLSLTLKDEYMDSAFER